jgi:hypothetical protein
MRAPALSPPTDKRVFDLASRLESTVDQKGGLIRNELPAPGSSASAALISTDDRFAR